MQRALIFLAGSYFLIAALQSVGSQKMTMEVRPLNIPQLNFEERVDPQLLHQSEFVATAMNTLPGLQVKKYGGAGQLQTISVRGLRANATLVMLDDILLNGQGDGSFDLGNLLSGSIQNVGFAVTPYHNIYHAPGGLIEMQTRRSSDENLHQFKTEVGSYGTTYTHLQVGQRAPRYRYVLHGEGLYTLGIPQKSVLRKQGEKDKYKTGALAGAFDVDITPFVNLDVVGRAYDSTLCTDLGVVQPLADPQGESYNQFRFLRAKLTYDQGTGISHTFVSGMVKNKRTIKDSYRYVSDEKTLMGRYRLRYQPDRYTYLQTGISVMGQSFKAAVMRREIVSRGFVDGQGMVMPGLLIGGGVTCHHLAAFGGACTAAGKIQYEISPGWFAKSILRTSLRYPTLSSRFADSPQAVPNPELKPEKGHVWEVGLTYAGEEIGGELFYFLTDTRNLIWTKAVALGIYKRLNGSLRTQGIEATFSFQRDSWKVYGSYTYTHSMSASSPLLDRAFPVHKVHLGGNYLGTQNWGITGSATLVGARIGQDYNSYPTQPVKLKAYVLMEGEIYYVLGENRKVYLRVENALNQAYEDVAGYATPGRTFWMGVSVAF